MAKRTTEAAGLIIIIIIGALIGTVIGEIIALLAPGGILERLFSKGVSPGIVPPATLDLKVLTLTLGFSLKLNLASLFGIVIALYIYRRL